MDRYSNLIERADMLCRQERLDMAAESLQQAIAEDPDRSIAYSMLSILKSDQPQTTEAMELAQRGIALGPDESYAYYAMSVVLTRQKKFSEADQAIATAIEFSPTHSDYHGQRAAIAIHQNRWQDAIDYAEAGLQFDPDDVKCNNLRAIALTHSGRREEAGLAIESVLQNSPEDPVSHANLGWTRLHEGRPDDAAEHFREALRLDPNSDWARQGIVEALKGKNFVYRQFLRYSLWVSRFSAKAQMLAFIGIIVLLQLLIRMPEGSLLRTAGIWLGLLYALFVGSLWLASPLFDLLLRVSRLGRLALTDDQKSDSNYLLLALVFIGGLMAGPIVTGFRMFDLLNYAFLTIPMAVMLSTPRRAKRKQAALAVVVIYAIAAVYWYRWYIDCGIDGLAGAASINQFLSGLEGLPADGVPDDERYTQLLEHAFAQRRLQQYFFWPSVLMSWASGYLRQSTH
ncbi:MAG: tetratricopeptide repeat protein [Planctomycetota bacterium]